MFEGFNRVFAGGFEGWVKAEDDTDNERSADGDGEDLPTDKWGEWGD